MADNQDARRRGSSHRGERKLIDVASFLSRTGPLTVKPMENIMFEIDTSSSQRKTVLPKIEQTNHQEPTKIEVKQQEGAPAPSKIDVNCHEVGLAPSKIEQIHRNNKNGFGTSTSLGSFTIAQLGIDRIKIPNTERKYNPGVLQGNWFYERMHPKYKPIHHPPLNNCNREYRSIYKDAFINYNLKDLTSVMPIKKDNSLPPWVVKEDVDKNSSCMKSVASKQATHPGHKSHTRENDYGGKDPYKGHDLDPFKRRDEYRTGNEYKLDAFQLEPSRWDRYGGRETYFKRQNCANRYSHDETTENGILNSGDVAISAELQLAQRDPSQIQGNSQPESRRTTRAQQTLETSQGDARLQTSGMDQIGKPNEQYARSQDPGMNQGGCRPTDNHARPQPASGMIQGGRPTDQYARPQDTRMNQAGCRSTDHDARPQQSSGMIEGGGPNDKHARPHQVSGISQGGKPNDKHVRPQQASGMIKGGKPNDKYVRPQQASGMNQGGKPNDKYDRPQQASDMNQGGKPNDKYARPQQASDMNQGGKPNEQYARSQDPGMNQGGCRPTDHHARPQQASGMIQGGRPTYQYARPKQASGMIQGGKPSGKYARPKRAPDISHVDIIRQIESDIAKMKISTEYKASFKAKENIAITAASKRKERNLALFAAGRNMSTFAF